MCEKCIQYDDKIARYERLSLQINDRQTLDGIAALIARAKDMHYYTPDGRSIKKAFLRSPLEYSRISSGFSEARFHPILQRWRAHKGIDYAAASGTGVAGGSSGYTGLKIAGDIACWGSLAPTDLGTATGKATVMSLSGIADFARSGFRPKRTAMAPSMCS